MSNPLTWYEDGQDLLARVKFVDDVTVSEVVPKKKLELRAPTGIIGPSIFEDSSDYELPANKSLLQKEVTKIKQLSDNLLMKLNADKTKIFIINFSKQFQFQPRIQIPGSAKPLEIVDTTKLVGVTLSSDLKFHTHVNTIVKKDLDAKKIEVIWFP